MAIRWCIWSCGGQWYKLLHFVVESSALEAPLQQGLGVELPKKIRAGPTADTLGAEHMRRIAILKGTHAACLPE